MRPQQPPIRTAQPQVSTAQLARQSRFGSWPGERSGERGASIETERARRWEEDPSDGFHLVQVSRVEREVDLRALAHASIERKYALRSPEIALCQRKRLIAVLEAAVNLTRNRKAFRRLLGADRRIDRRIGLYLQVAQ